MEPHFYKTITYRNGVAHESGFTWPAPSNAPSNAPSTPKETLIRPTSTTGLLTKEDFAGEAKNLGVSTPEMLKKFASWFARRDNGEVGEGMARMQCNMLIKNAAKKLNKP